MISLAKGHKPTEYYIRLLREKLATEFPGVTFYFLPADIVSQILNFGLPAPIDIQVAGRNIEGNRKFALNLLERLRQVTGIADLRMQQPFDQPKLDVEVDRVKAQQAGFSQREVASNLLITLSGSFQTNPTFWLNPKTGVSYNVITQVPQYELDSLQALANIPLTSQGGAKSEILGNLATVTRGSERAVISHWNVQPAIDIYANVQGRDLGAVADDVAKIMDESREGTAEGLQDDSARAGRHHAVLVQRPAAGPDICDPAGISADGGEFPIVARPFHHHHRAAGCAGGYPLDVVRHAHHDQRAGPDRRNHGNGNRHRQLRFSW